MQTIKLLLVMLFSLAIAACGGGGGGTSTPSTPTPQTGILTDAAVGGVAYTTAPSGLTGTTDSSGAYKFNPGDTVIFKLGSLVLGNVTATGIVSPTDLANGDANKLQNLLVVLQSLDADGNPNNGIVIPPAAAAAVTTAIDLSVAPASLDTAALRDAMTAGGIPDTTPVVTPTDANAHYLAQGTKLLSSNVWVSLPASNTAGSTVLLRFSENGEYLHGQDGANVGAGTAGVEYGTQTLTSFDVNGYRLSAITSVDTNGDRGISNPQPCDRLRSVGDQLIATEGITTNNGVTCTNNSVNATISKAENNPTGIVGVWALDSATTIKTQHIVFSSNGQFLLTDPIGGVEPDGVTINPSGIESGSYTYDTNTKTLKITPTFDTNGKAGFSHNGAATVGEPFFISLGGSTATAVDNVGSYTFHRVLPPAAPSPYAGTWAASFKLKTVGGNNCGATAANIGVVQSFGSLVVDSVGNFVLMNDLNLNFAMMAGTISANGQFNATWFGDSLLPAGTPGKSPTCPAGTVTGTMASTSNGVVTLSQGGDTGDITLSHVDPMIVGTWYDGDTNRVLTFFAYGDYMHAKSVTTNAGAFPGLEHGTYTWNSTTGAFAGACPPDVDTNGTDGLSHPNGIACTGSTSTTGTATVNGDTMSYTVNGNPTLNLIRVVGSTNPLVGSWYGGGANTNLTFTFFANGDYMQAQSIISGTDPNAKPGLEHGTYTWNPTTGAFVAACPAIDTNGTAGFSNSVGGCGTTNTIVVNGNTATFTNNTTGEITTISRVGSGGGSSSPPPPAANAIVGSWSNLKANGVSPANGIGGSNIVLTFFTNGDYMMAQSVASEPSTQVGIEHGTYTWNSGTGAFSTPCPTVDTNGQAGFSHSTPSLGCTGTNTTITVSGNTMSLLDNSTNPPTPLTLERVADAANPLVGTWSYLILTGASPTFGGGTNITFTYFANGDYMMAQSETPPFATSGAMPGLEHGTYSFDATTGVFTTPGCPPIDTNGMAGFSHSTNVCGAFSGTGTITGNTLTGHNNINGNNFTFTRVTP